MLFVDLLWDHRVRAILLLSSSPFVWHHIGADPVYWTYMDDKPATALLCQLVVSSSRDEATTHSIDAVRDISAPTRL